MKAMGTFATVAKSSPAVGGYSASNNYGMATASAIQTFLPKVPFVGTAAALATDQDPELTQRVAAMDVAGAGAVAAGLGASVAIPFSIAAGYNVTIAQMALDLPSIYDENDLDSMNAEELATMQEVALAGYNGFPPAVEQNGENVTLGKALRDSEVYTRMRNYFEDQSEPAAIEALDNYKMLEEMRLDKEPDKNEDEFECSRAEYTTLADKSHSTHNDIFTP